MRRTRFSTGRSSRGVAGAGQTAPFVLKTFRTTCGLGEASMKPGYLGALAMAGALALIGCDSGASAVAARDHSQSAVVETAPVDVKADPAPLVDGKPIWTSN